MKKLYFIIFLGFICSYAFAQNDSTATVTDTTHVATKKIIRKPVIRKPVIDTVKKADTLHNADTLKSVLTDSVKQPLADTLKLAPKPVIVKKPIDTFYLKLLNNPYLKMTGKPLYLVINERQKSSKDEMFYLLSGLLLFLAFIRLVFSRYFKNIFRLFFQPTFRQKQTREQLLQSSFPSLLLNLFFIFSGGAYISFLISHYQLTSLSFWWLLLYSTSALLILYTGKFLLLTFAGWVFNVKEATETYIFAVYLINKIAGVLLIPFTLLIAFSKPQVTNISITISLLLVGLLFIYRYLVSFAPVHREVRVSPLHFLFYIFAFEITPLLLIYKTVVLYLNKSL